MNLSILEHIHSREDLLRLSKQEQNTLCGEIREFLIQKVSVTGGHLASNLGIVEATLAIHKVFDTAKDRLVFDVGHQSYVHKILTGRADQFDSLRRIGGLSGFPKPQESVHDAFIAGHASNAVSVALGMARARTQNGENHHVIALMGDGAMTGGLAYEGLNDTGASGEQVIVILNDNGMSINKNVGGISTHLSLLRLKPGYFTLKKVYRKVFSAIPGGKWIYRQTHRIKDFLKRSLIGTPIFEEMGLNYLGPVDGHDVDKIAYLLRVAKELQGPTLVHIITQKGRGYKPAETRPEDYHGVGHFDPELGVSAVGSGQTYSNVFGQTLAKIAAENPKVCAITAAMPSGTGLDRFAQDFSDRFYDVGIAEGHAVSMAAGLASGGMIPVVALYSTFLQRGFDMLLHDVALMQNHVIFAVDRAGLVGEDGPTHHGVFDVGYLRQIPGMVVLSPATAEELSQAMYDAVYLYQGPVAIRYPRGCCLDKAEISAFSAPIPDARVSLVAYGNMTEEITQAAHLLQKIGIPAQTVQINCIKPLDFEMLRQLTRNTKHIFVAEDTSENGCIGAAIAAEFGSRVTTLNLGDKFIPHGTVKQLRTVAGLDAETIAAKVQEVLRYEK